VILSRVTVIGRLPEWPHLKLKPFIQHVMQAGF
jgi:hypothetical protein